MNRIRTVLHQQNQQEDVWKLMRCLQTIKSLRSGTGTNQKVRHHTAHPPQQQPFRYGNHRHHNFGGNDAVAVTTIRQHNSIYAGGRRRQFSESSEQHEMPQPTTAIPGNTAQPATRQSNYGYRDLLRWTENILHPTRTPIGSIQPSLWQDIFVAMQVWLGYTPSLTVEQLLDVIKSSNDPSNAVMIEATESLIPRHVDLVDRLLSRLLYEQSAYRNNGTIRTHRRRMFQQHDQQLQLWTTILCQSWLTVTKDYPDAPMTIQKASMWYEKMNETVWSTPYQQSQTQPQLDYEQFLQNQQQQKIPFFVALIQAHQRLVDSSSSHMVRSQACQTVVDMLLDETTVTTILPNCTNTPYADVLKSCHQLALQQTLELVAADNAATSDSNQSTFTSSTTTTITSTNIDLVSTASQIMEQIKQLSEIPGWSDIGFQSGELDKVFDALFLDRMKGDVGQPEKAKKKLSAYERESLQQRILTKINQAMTQKDQETVEEMVLYWRSHMQDDDEGKDTLQWKPFAQAVTNFYLRMQDPVKATKWMQIQEQMPSREAVQQAMQSTTARPSIALMDETTINDSATSNFEELLALNRVFAEDEQERIKQKLNLLDIWVTKVRSPSVPWRATEILESLENEKNSLALLTPETYSMVVKLWLQNKNDMTGIAGQKALDIAMRCPVFDMSLFIIITNLMVKRQEAGDKMAPQAIFNIVDLVKEKFDDIPNDQMEVVVSNTFKLLYAMPQSLEFLKFILEKGIDITSDIMNVAVHSYQPNVALLLVLHDIDTEARLEPSTGYYKAAIQHLLGTTPLTPKIVDRAAQLLCDVTIIMAKNNEAIDDILDLNFNSFKPIASVQYKTFTERMLYNLEKTIFTKDDPMVTPLYDAVYITKNALTSPDSPFFAPDQPIERTMTPEDKVELRRAVVEEVQQKKVPAKHKKSPIPIEFYKNVMLLFAEKRNASMMEFLYERLKEHRANGYAELLPDQSFFAVYLSVSRQALGLYSLDSRVDQLFELIGRYESTNGRDDRFKPEYRWFDILVGDLHDRFKLSRVKNEQALKKRGADSVENDSRAAVKLLAKMHKLRIVPNKLDRVYPFNVAMELMLASRNQLIHFQVVSTLKEQLDDLGIVANSYTMNLILNSCERAIAKDHFAALTAVIQCLKYLRQTGKAHPAVYVQCFRVFQMKRKLSDREFVIAEKMMATVFKCCIDDGMLNNPVRYQFKALTLPITYQRSYFDLLQEGNEPTDWTRNANKVL